MFKTALVLAVAIATANAASSGVHVRSQKIRATPLTRPSKFSASFYLTLPYSGLSIPRATSVDLTTNRLRMTDLGGIFDNLYDHSGATATQKTYTRYVRGSAQTCIAYNDPGSVDSMSVIPHVENFKFVGTGPCPDAAAFKDGVTLSKESGSLAEREQSVSAYRKKTLVGSDGMCDRFEYNYEEGKFLFGRVEYAVASGTSTPIQLQWFGHCNITGSHRDEYVFDFTDYSDTIPSDAFTPFTSCPFAVDSAKTMGSTAFEPVRDPVRTALSRQLVKGTRERLEHDFRDFFLTHGKGYKNEEERENRMAIFAKNLAMIDRHNLDESKTYKMAMNHLGDHTEEEYRKFTMSGCARGADKAVLEKNIMKNTEMLSATELPSYVDWTEHGVAPKPRDQAWCGSCWSFAAAEAAAGMTYLAGGREFTELSPQSLVDCVWTNITTDGQGGCAGYDAVLAWQWAIDNRDGYIATEKSYPYLATDDYCKPVGNWVPGTQVTGYTVCKQGDVTCAKTLLSKGPAAIAIDASHPSFGFYSHGTYYEPACGNTLNDLDHAVLAVGYGTDENGEEYMLVANSWSTRWGEGSNNGEKELGGYIRMSMKNNNCGTMTELAQPKVNVLSAFKKN